MVQSPSRKSIIKRGSSTKEKDENQIEKVLGDIGYSFEGITNKEKELQFQTNRIGKDFDKLLHEMKQFQRTIKTKLNINYTDGEAKLNTLKDIFLLDNKADMKNAVDRVLNKIKEPFDKEAYKIKVDKEKLEEIKDLIDKKIEEYNYGENKYDYSKKIYDEKEQMIHNNIINKYEYRKYRQKVNNKVTTLPSIFIKASKFIMSKDDKDKLTIKKTNKSSTQSTQSKNIVFKNIKEETIHFGDTVKQDSEFESKENSQISQLPVINHEEEKKENEDNMEKVEAKSEDWLSDNGEDKEDNSKNEENKSKEKNSGNTNKSNVKNESNKTKEKSKEKEEEKEDNKNEEKGEQEKGDDENENDENENDENDENENDENESQEKQDDKNEEDDKEDKEKDDEENDEEDKNDGEEENKEITQKKNENGDKVDNNNNNDDNEDEDSGNE